MELDLQGEHAARSYAILHSLVTPRPIAWITTVDARGVVNAAPFSSFNVGGSSPGFVMMSIGERDGDLKDTARNIELTGEFVVNLVDEPLAAAMSATSASLPYGVSELDGTGLTTAPSTSVRPPRIAESPAGLECELHHTLPIGTSRLVVGIVKRVHVKDEYFDPATLRIVTDDYLVVGRMASPNRYCLTRDRFQIERPD